MPLLETIGAGSSKGFGQLARTGPINYIEDVFQTWLYTGNGSTQTITNGVDLAGKGGMVWSKTRSTTFGHAFIDTARGVNQVIFSNTTDAQTTYGSTVTAFNSNGYSLGNSSQTNQNGDTYASWTFRKQPKFFDVVTYTGNGSSLRSLPHSLGSTPGFIIVKKTSAAGNWGIYHRSLPALGKTVYLNSTIADGDAYLGFTPPTASIFYVGGGGSGISGGTVASNENGQTYVAYLFAHDAGGFGASGTDNVISCGSATGNLSTLVVTLGYEPQWLLFKRTDASDSWYVWDNMRGFGVDNSNSLGLIPNYDFAEAVANYASVTSTGFNPNYFNPSTIIYIAIRRGPMRTPTTGTSVFSPVAYQGNADGIAGSQTISIGFPSDSYIQSSRTRLADTSYYQITDRLRGYTRYLNTSAVWDESAFGSPTTYMTGFDNQTGMPLGKAAAWNWNGAGNATNAAHIVYALRRAPGFFDVVCYTGTGSARTVNHNLGVVPELMIVKVRNASLRSWAVFSAALGNTKVMYLESVTDALTISTFWNNTSPTNSVFTVGSSTDTNNLNDTYVAYLFATVAGVSKVGSYTGTGTTLQVNCGFTAGSRFVLIKRTDSTGSWYVWDSSRGIVAGNDPYLLLNSTDAEATSTDYVDTYSAGFEISSTAPAAINASGGSYIFLAIA